GPIAGTVEDAATLFEVIAGHDPSDSTSVPEPPPTIVAGLGEGVEGLRVGLTKELLEGADADVVARVEEAARAFEKAGGLVAEASVPAAVYGISAYYLIAPAEASSNLARYDGVRY